MADYNEIKNDAKTRMEKSLESLKADFGGLRAGRRTPACWTAFWSRPTVR